MDELEDMFRDLERDVSAEFTDEKTREIWGDDITIVEPDKTIKSAGAGFPASRPGRGGDESIVDVSVDTRPGISDSTVMLSIHADGTASMTMPGASVTLSPRRTTVEGRSSITAGVEYEIGEMLGKGGMGVVHVARQASLDRRIVVKSIRPEFAGRPEAQEKFITEALATGSLDHPNVVPIHDMGVGADGNLFYVMKEVRGKNWREVLLALTEAENIDILFRVCDAIACAHDRGIIHRDLKPENVMLGDYGEVLVMDWGLAAAISPTAKASHLTDASACAGTPSFMAPEMARGLAHDLGPWSDQYLLGAILYNILTGRPPHPGKNAQEGVRNAANNVIVPSERKDEWMNVALRAMHTIPYKRFPSVKAFQKALRNCQIHSESIVLTNKGDEELAKARETDGHSEFTRAINAYEQALVLWKDNVNAAAKLAEARFAYAESAFAGGDYGLVLSLLDNAQSGRERELVGNAKKELALREARRRRVRVLSILAVSLLLLVAAVSGAAYFIISRQAEAERQARAEAERQRHVADRRRVEADEQRQIAEEQRTEANEQRSVAEEQRQKAEDALQVAETARSAEAKAKDQQLREQEAKLAAEERARQRAEEALRAKEEIQRLGYLEDNSRWRFDADEAVRRQAADAEKFGLPVERTINLPGAPMLMKLIPAGYYVMGSPPRDPARNADEYLHEVELARPLHMGTTEVTRAQWQAVVGVEKLEDLHGLDMQPDEKAVVNVAWRLRPVPESERDFPAAGISYDDIMNVFLPKLAEAVPDGKRFRLPTEAEWEWAARAGSTGHFYNGDAREDLETAAWYENNSDGRVHRVGQKTPNAWGLHDIIGNVWEFNLDSYDSLYYLRAPRTDPVNLDPAVSMKVCRGGSFINSPRLCRMSFRGTYTHRENRYPQAGFRLVYADWDLEGMETPWGKITSTPLDANGGAAVRRR